MLQLPSGEPRDVALFAHCFTCSKDSRAARWIAEALVVRGIAVFRFDFTGLGSSEGSSPTPTFVERRRSRRAADRLRSTHRAPGLADRAQPRRCAGGAGAAARIPEARAVATIGAPADPGHVANLFGDRIEEIRSRGEGEVELDGRVFRIRQVSTTSPSSACVTTSPDCRPLLVLHAPTDQTVSIDDAAEIFAAARHPKSFVSLDDADHLLSCRRDARYAGEVIAAWSQRYLTEPVGGRRTTRPNR